MCENFTENIASVATLPDVCKLSTPFIDPFYFQLQVLQIASPYWITTVLHESQSSCASYRFSLCSRTDVHATQVHAY